MGKKEVVILIALLFLSIFLANAPAELDADLSAPNVDVLLINETEYLEKEMVVIAPTQYEDVPEPVRKAFIGLIEAKQQAREEEEEKLLQQIEKKDALMRNIIYLSIAAFLLVFILLLREKGFFHKLKRKSRRQVLYRQIIKLGRKGLAGKEILKVLMARGWERKYVDDAIARYKRHMRKGKEQVPSKYSLMKEDRSVRAVARKLRRQYLYFLIVLSRRYKGRTLKETEDLLRKKGWNKLYVDDAVYRYNMYVEGKKGVISRILFKLIENSSVHKMRRALRRQALYSQIRRLKRKGKPHHEIIQQLSKKGWQAKQNIST